MSYTILVVDDDPLERRFLEVIVEKKLGYKALSADSGKAAIALLESDEGKDVDLVLLDWLMPDVNGDTVIKSAQATNPDLPFIVVTAHANVNVAVEAMKMGVKDFIEKHESPEYIELSVRNTLQATELTQEVSRLKRSISGQVLLSDIIGSSTAIKDTIAMAQKAAESNIAVLIKGDSGVGKELFAQAIHGSSDRVEKPFVAVNCGAIPQTLVESTLFGHEKGAFTGALYKSLGKFREADGGTLFLDEIGELSQEVQVKLLRALQEGEIEPVGGKLPVKVDVRIISATHRNLKQAVKEGEFREDLYYRLNVYPFTIPPLRERGNDIDELIDFFFTRICATEKRNLRGISDEARQLIRDYHWPGNIRQLENVIFRAIILCETDDLQVKDFIHIKAALDESNATSSLSSVQDSAEVMQLIDHSNHFKSIHTIEGEVIRAALEHYNWRISEVARRLGIGRSTLYRKMHDLGIEHHDDKESHNEEVA